MAKSGDSESLSTVATQLARRWATQRLAAVQSYGRILADYGQGRASSGATFSAYAKLAVEETARYSADAIGILTDYAAAVANGAGLDLGLDSSAASSTPEVRDLALSGAVGGEAVGEFYLSNPHDHSVAISFSASNFAGPQGEAPVGPTIEPAHAVVPEGQERRVVVRAALDGAYFQADRTYTAHIAVAGFDHLLIRVRLTVTHPL